MHCNNTTNPDVEISQKSARISFKQLIYFTVTKCFCKTEELIMLRTSENKLNNSRVYVHFKRNTSLLHSTYKMKVDFCIEIIYKTNCFCYGFKHKIVEHSPVLAVY